MLGFGENVNSSNGQLRFPPWIYGLVIMFLYIETPSRWIRLHDYKMQEGGVRAGGGDQPYDE
jgi:hypothetical protein